MDLFGKEGEKAAEAVQNLSERIEDLESHVNAVDQAVQDLKNQEIEQPAQEDPQATEENREKIKDLEELIMKLTEIQKKNLDDMQAEESRDVRMKDKINALDQRLKRTREEQKDLQNQLNQVKNYVGDVEEKIVDVEDELTSGTELNKSRIHSRVTEEKFEREIKDVKQEISRLKTSINALSDEPDDKVRTD